MLINASFEPLYTALIIIQLVGAPQKMMIHSPSAKYDVEKCRRDASEMLHAAVVTAPNKSILSIEALCIETHPSQIHNIEIPQLTD